MQSSSSMRTGLGLVALVVRDYDEAKAFYLDVLGFQLVEDTPVPEQDKRWLVVRPRGSSGACVLLARAANEEQRARVGSQAGGRVFLFVYTDDLRRDVAALKSRGVVFVREPQVQPHGTVAVFWDLYGNLWDLIEPSPRNRSWPAAGPAMALRLGTGPDAVTVAALATQVFLDTYAADGLRPDLAREAFTLYSADAFAARLAEPARAFLLAESAGHLTGFAEILLVDREAPAGGAKGAELVRLYVQPKAQGRGIGRALLASAEKLALRMPVSTLWLTAWEGNARARAFYARAGYADVGAAVHAIEGRAYANRVLARSWACASARPEQGEHVRR